MPLYPPVSAGASPATTTTQGIVKLAGDFASSSTANAPIVGSLSGSSPLNVTPNTVQWISGAATPTWTQAVLGGTGATAGVALTVAAQAGQAQTGATANNNGGALILSGGAAGTGGSGAAGLAGVVKSTTSHVHEISNTSAAFGTGVSHIVVNNLAAGAQTRLEFQVQGTIKGGVRSDSLGGFYWYSGTGQFHEFVDLSANIFMVIDAGGPAIWPAAGSGYTAVSGGDRGIAIHNCGVAPTATSQGGGFIFVQSGALKYRGDSGTVTTLAPA